MRHFINQTKGKFFTIDYKKADGTTRKMLARTGVRKGLVGTGRSTPSHLISVYDVANKGYRSINPENVLIFKCGDMEVTR